MPDQETFEDRIEKRLNGLNHTSNMILRAERIKALGAEPIKSLWFDNTEVLMYLPDAQDDLIQSKILTHGKFYEEKLLRKVKPYIPAGANVVDVGANIGNHSMFFAKVCQAAFVHSFEPQERLVRVIMRNMELNGICAEQFKIHQCGCGAQTGKLSIVSGHVGNLGATQFKYSDDGDFDVSKLDDCEIQKVEFLKIDAERLGDEVLKGAAALIANHKPIIWIELYDEESDRAKEILANMGYDLEERMTRHDFLYVPRQ